MVDNRIRLRLTTGKRAISTRSWRAQRELAEAEAGKNKKQDVLGIEVADMQATARGPVGSNCFPSSLWSLGSRVKAQRRGRTLPQMLGRRSLPTAP